MSEKKLRTFNRCPSLSFGFDIFFVVFETVPQIQMDFISFSTLFFFLKCIQLFKSNYFHIENEHNGNNKEENKIDRYWVKLYIANDLMNSTEGYIIKRFNSNENEREKIQIQKHTRFLFFFFYSTNSQAHEFKWKLKVVI